MRKRICSLLLISILLLSITVVFVSGEPNDITGCKLGKVHVDASSVLRELGYTDENMSSVPDKLLIQIIRSYESIAKLHDDGDYYVTITVDSPRADINLIGTDRTNPYQLDLSTQPTSRGTFDAEASTRDSPNLLNDLRGCLVFAIWDYPGEFLVLNGKK